MPHQPHNEHFGSFNQPISFNIMGSMSKPIAPPKTQNFGGDIFKNIRDTDQNFVLIKTCF